MRKLCCGLALLSLPLAAAEQPPSGSWRSLQTEHFVLHYPAADEAWVQRAAQRLEAVRLRVIEEVGYTPPERVDVVVGDPVADANGAAYPILGWPRLELWTSPPEADSELGAYRDYTELLLVHEVTHLVHLLRPSRNPFERALEKVLPVGPIPLAAPRWVMEGYATVVEGRLTAAGRPNSDLRAAILRRWAESGRLPGYAQLASDPHSWQGMSMAYLLGSAYLEWLEQRAGPGSLRKLWARMTAGDRRTFEQAFRGVFDGTPASLYDRFCAELYWRSLEAERRVEAAGPPSAREGSVFAELSWSTGAPAVSPDGSRIAAVVRSRDLPAELTVWSTAVDERASREETARRSKTQAADPEDVPALAAHAPPHKILARLGASRGVAPRMPRWLPGGEAILFVRFEPDGSGVLHPDLFRWTLASGEVDRLTHAADLRDPDPAPDGRSAIAVRDRNGGSQLVTVDLASGAVTELTPSSLEQVYDRPRWSPDGRCVAVARSGEGAWHLVLYAYTPGALHGAGVELPAPAGATIATPAWSADGAALYAVVGEGGFIDLWRFPAPSASAGATAGLAGPVPLTRTTGAALAPAPSPDGSSLYFLGLKPEGLELRRLDLKSAVALAPTTAPADLAPAVRPLPPPVPAAFELEPPPPSHPYGLGRQELLPFVGTQAASAGAAGEIGVRSGDVVGKLDLVAVGAFSGSGAAGMDHGGSLAGTFRGWPITLGLQIFTTREEPGLLPGAAAASRALPIELRGGELAGTWEQTAAGSLLGVAGRALFERVDEGGSTISRESARLEASESLERRLGAWRLSGLGDAQFELGATAGRDWQRFGGGLQLEARSRHSGLTLAWDREGSHRADQAVDLYELGGMASSLLPESVLAGRILEPALPFASLLGTEHEGERVELLTPWLPVPIVYQRHRLWGGPAGNSPAIELLGLEPKFAIGPIPLLRLPGFSLRTGVARLFAGTREPSTRWWLETVWRP